MEANIVASWCDEILTWRSRQTMGSPQTNDSQCAIYVDMGTTNTRAWLMLGGHVVARASRNAGVRDTARDGSPKKIHTALREIVSELRGKESSNSTSPTAVVAAGMISSPLGLAEVPHVYAPAGMADLAAGSRWFHLPQVTDLPILLIPGVRSGMAGASLDSIHETDVMRGEETLCVGLMALGLIEVPAIVLNLGSHWKAIQLDERGGIASSVTTLSGELIHATQSQTILASSVPQERPIEIAETWKNAGMKEQRRAGLARALFCVRLLELSTQGTPEERLAFLTGAFIASDLDGLAATGMLKPEIPVLIAGPPALAEAWRAALAQRSLLATVLTSAQVEESLLAGLRNILADAHLPPVADQTRKVQA